MSIFICLKNAEVKPLYKKVDTNYYDKLQSDVSSTVFEKAMHSRLLVPAATRSKAWVCGRSPAAIVGSNPAGDMVVECCVFSGRVLCDKLFTLQRSPTDCGVSCVIKKPHQE
jgi:hypothetical protein